MQTILNITLSAGLLLVGSCSRSDESTTQPAATQQHRIDVSLEREGMITVHHPGDIPTVSILWEEDGFIVNHNLGMDGTPFSVGGSVFRVWMKGQNEGRVWVTRNCGNEEHLASDADRSQYEDFDGDGVVDYKRSKDGVYRVAEIIWEKIGEIPDIPPDHPNIRKDSHRGILNNNLNGTPSSESKPENGQKPQPEADGLSR